MASKKDYRAIGEALREGFNQGGFAGQRDIYRRHVAERVADVFAQDSPRFDRERFLRFVETGIDKA